VTSTTIDPPASVASVVGMILGVALLENMLFVSGTRKPSRARLRGPSVYGVSGRFDTGVDAESK
jgi:hypothetical protein